MSRRTLALALWLLAGCLPAPPAPPAPPTPPTPPPAPTALDFEPEAGAQVRLASARLADGEVRVKVECATPEAVYGLAFRVTYEPELLAFERLERAAAVDVGLASEPWPGLVVVGLSLRGQREGVRGEVAWGELVLRARATGTARLSMVPARSAALDARLEPLEVRFGGGRLTLR